MATRTIAVCNFKGGVGKTVLSVNLAAGLSRREKKRGVGYRVLLIDADAQANASTYILGQKTWEEKIYPDPGQTLYGMLYGALSNQRNTIHLSELPGGGRGNAIFGDNSEWPGLYLLPSHYNLALAEDLFKSEEVLNLPGRNRALPPHGLLSYLMRDVKKEFDFIILDCPPNIYNVSRNALFFADEIIVPVIPDWLSVSGLTWLILTLGEQFKRFGQKKRIRAIVPTMWSQAAVYARQMDNISARLYEEWQNNVNFKRLLKGCEFWTGGLMRSVDVAKSVEEFRPLLDFSRSNKVRLQIETMVDHLLGIKQK